MLEFWVEKHIFGVLLAIEVLWVGGFLAIFIVYFLVKRHFARQRVRAAAEKESDEP